MVVVELIFGLAFGGVGLLVAATGGMKLRNAVTIWRSDPVSVREAAQSTGTAEFEGTVRRIDGEHTFDAPFAGEEAVLATYEVERKEKSSSGSRGSRTSWKTVEEGAIRRPFLVADETGRVAVDPAGAEVSPANEEQRTTASDALPDDVRLRLSVLTDEFDLASILPQATGRTRRFTEGHVSPGDPVHVYGTQVAERAPRDSPADARVEDSDTADLFQISAGDESAAIKRTVAAGVGLLLFGLVFAGVGVGALAVALLG